MSDEDGRKRGPHFRYHVRPASPKAGCQYCEAEAPAGVMPSSWDEERAAWGTRKKKRKKVVAPEEAKPKKAPIQKHRCEAAYCRSIQVEPPYCEVHAWEALDTPVAAAERKKAELGRQRYSASPAGSGESWCWCLGTPHPVGSRYCRGTRRTRDELYRLEEKG